jgi:PAS domain S-box-containing protein
MHKSGNIVTALLTCFVTLIVTLFLMDSQAVFEPSSLLPVLNTLFLSIIPLFIVFTATTLFLTVGHLSFLMLGCGMLVLGAGGCLSGWFIGQTGGPNITITIYNSGALLSALLLLINEAVLLCAPRNNPVRHRLPLLIVMYLAVVVVFGTIVFAAVFGITPPFIVQGGGPTLTGTAVLVTAIVGFCTAAALCARQYANSQIELLRWYAAGLTLLAFGLTGVLLQKCVGSPIGWVGRAAQYTGGICILIGVLSFWKEKISTGQSLGATFEDFSRKRISELEQINAHLQRVIAEQQHTEAALRANRVLLTDIINGTSDAIYAKDRLGRYTMFNAAAEGFVGKGAAEVLGRDDGSLFPAAEAAMVMESDRNVIEGGVVKTFEEVVTDAVGRTVTFLSTKGPVFGVNGEPIGLFGIARDISERKTLELKLAESEIRYRTLVMDAPFLVTNVDRNGVIQLINKSSGGGDPDSVIGTCSYDYLDGDSKEIYRAALEKSFQAQSPQRITVKGFGDNGSLRWFETVLGPIVTAGQVASVIQVSIDVTERKQMEQDLCNSEMLFRTLSFNAPVGIYRTDTDGNCFYVNSKWCQLTGIDKDDAMGAGWTRALHPEDRDKVFAEWSEAVSSKRKFSLEYRFMTPSGTVNWVKGIASELTGVSNEISGYVGCVTDITGLKQAEETLKRYSRRLLVLEEEMKKKIAMELHDDIGQELAALSFNLAHIGHHLQEKTEKNLQSVLDDSRALTKEIIRTVRTLMVELHPLQLEDCGLAETIRMYANQFEQRTGIAVAVEVPPQFPRLAAKKEIALFRITQEALNNIVKHAAAAKVSVSLTNDGKAIQLSIMDDGKGFSPESAHSLPTGSGWGLTTMRERAEVAGGAFRITSALGEGASIKVEIREGV